MGSRLTLNVCEEFKLVVVCCYFFLCVVMCLFAVIVGESDLYGDVMLSSGREDISARIP